VRRVEASVVVPVDPATAFAVSQLSGPVRLRWDPFVVRQQFLGGATAPAKGVLTSTVQRFGLRMISEYVSFRPPSTVGMRMMRGPWFFERFAGGWRFDAEPGPNGEPGTRAVWRYSFACRPAWLAPLAERIGERLLQREIDRHLDGFARGCRDEAVLAAARAALA